MGFSEYIKNYNWDFEKKSIYSKTREDVINALHNPKRDLEDFKALISPVASQFLEQMASLSNRFTLERFGKTIQLYIPLYLSNECTNYCLYCGFNHNNKDIKRITLNEEQILEEIKTIKSYGYEHILLVTGEAPKKAGIEYLKKAIKIIKPYFSLISMEVFPLAQNDYEELIELGINTVYIYQETYNKDSYKYYHAKGKKSNYNYRINTPDRLGKAGIHKIGLGSLIGLQDWRTDAFYTCLHLKYLEKTFWKTKYSVSFPRLRPFEGNFKSKYTMTDKELVQLICAFRIFDQEVELSLTTRENQIFRDNAVRLGITSMSAGSKTEPGGYTKNYDTVEQFFVNDNRTPEQIMKMIKSKGYEAVWKDWDACM